MFLDVLSKKDWILSVMDGKTTNPFWIRHDGDGRSRKGNSTKISSNFCNITFLLALIFHDMLGIYCTCDITSYHCSTSHL